MALHFLIDWYNLLYALPTMPAGTWETKRLRLLEQLATQKPHGQNRATVIFDSREGLGDRTSHGGLDVIYTAGETADDWIIRRVREISQPRSVVVVTNDLGLRNMIRGTGVKWQSADEFITRMAKPPGKKQEAPKDFDAINEELKKEWGL